MNNEERRMWIENDESLYNWKKYTRLSMSKFISENKDEIDEYIDRQLHKNDERSRRYN